VSTFFVLPPRPLLARAYAEFLATVLPGVSLSHVTWGDVADALAAVLRQGQDVFLLHREDLPDGEDPARALVDGFGAEPGDEVVEVPATVPVGAPVRRWRLPEAA
jgi:hypothetical protein